MKVLKFLLNISINIDLEKNFLAMINWIITPNQLII